MQIKAVLLGVEMIYSKEVTPWYSFNLNGNLYQNTIDAFTVTNLYPVPSTYHGKRQQMVSGNLKWNNNLQLNKTLKAQVSAIYLAPDIIPQGKVDSRFSVDLGIKKTSSKRKRRSVFKCH